MEENSIDKVRGALKMLNDIEAATKHRGLVLLRSILSGEDARLSEYGYNEVIFRELTKTAKFESGELFDGTTNLLLEFYSNGTEHQDAIMETLIYICALSNNSDISLQCLKKISSLVDRMGDNIAKHAKQLTHLADIGATSANKLIIIEILQKTKTKLPGRKKTA